MAKQREVKQWITVNGNHVPIFEGESKADAVKRAFKGEKGPEVKKSKFNTPEGKKEYDLGGNEIHNGKKVTNMSKEELEKWEAEERNKHIESKKFSGEKKLSDGKSEFGKETDDKISKYQDKFLKGKSDKQIQEIKDNLEKSGKIVGTTEQDHIALAAIRKEQESRKSSGKRSKERETLEKMKQYPTMKADAEFKEWLMDNGMSINKNDFTNDEWRKLQLDYHDKKYAKSKTLKQIEKDLDTKEKQIAQNKADVDKLNGKKDDKQTKIDTYNEKVLNKRYEERQKFSKAGDGQFIVDFDEIGGTMNSFKDMAKRKGFEVVRSDGESVTLRKSSASTKSSVADLRKQALAAGYSEDRLRGMSVTELKKLLGRK